MKALVCGVENVFGVSAKGPWSIPSIYTLLPIEKFASPKATGTGYGYKFPIKNGQLEMLEIDPACIEQFAPYEGRFPLELDLDIDTQVVRGGYQSRVVGIRAKAAAVAPVSSSKEKAAA